MPLVDFDKLFLTADNLRNNAQVDKAIAFYQEIAGYASHPTEIAHKARALHMAGVSAKESVLTADSTYYRAAIEFFTQAEAAYNQANDSVGLGALYRDRAIVNDYAGQTVEATNWFHKSLEQLKSADAADALGITYDKFGLHYYKTGDYQTAARYINEALKILSREPSAGFFYATSLYDLARVQYRLGEFDQAIDAAEESLSWYAADHGDRSYQRRLAQLHGFLSLAYYQLSDTKKAQAAAQKYKALLKTFDPLAVKVLQKDLEELAR